MLGVTTVKAKLKTIKGFTIIEALVFLFIFVVSVLSIYQAFNVGINYIIDAKKKMAAVGLANEELEKYRNLGYENLQENDDKEYDIIKNGVAFRVVVNISEMDDEHDGMANNDANGAPTDYKKISVEVTWFLGNAARRVKLSANVVPPIIEQDLNKGYLRLHIIGEEGFGLPGVRVRITKKSTGNVVHTGYVNSAGDLFKAGLDPGEYKIEIFSDNNYFPLETLNTTSAFSPADDLKHIQIIADKVADKHIITDKKANLNVKIKDYFGNTISGLGFNVYGGKFMGTYNASSLKDYSFPEGADPRTVSNSDGTESFSELCFGPYHFNFTDLNDGNYTYHFLWIRKEGQAIPLNDETGKIELHANESLNIEAVLAREDISSLLVEVRDDDSQPIAGANVRLLFTGEPAYDKTLATNQFGQAFFPETSGGMINGEYSYTISAEGYASKSGTFTINQFTKKIGSDAILLDPS